MTNADPSPLRTMRGRGKLPKGSKPGDTPLEDVLDKAKGAVNSGLSKLGLKKKKRVGYGPGSR